jgi:hypothetical protein
MLIRGWNGVHYTPGENDPGYYFRGEAVTYVFTSDIPEPATIVLLTLGGIILRKSQR